MTDDLFTPLTGPTRNGAGPRKCRRHEWVAITANAEAAFAGWVYCARCGKVRDEARTKRGRSSRRLGNDQERRAEKVYGWEKIGERGGPDDLRGTLMKVQQKATRSAPPKRWTDIFAALDRVNDGRTPAILLSFVRAGVPTEDFVVVRGKDWIALHGKDEP